jgi:predicted HTH transcriptional regulator
VSIFYDRIEVQKPGRLPAPLTLATLGEQHELRNRVIADLLFNIRYIEGWNTGIRRMRDEMRRHGLPGFQLYRGGRDVQGHVPGAGDRILGPDPGSRRDRSARLGIERAPGRSAAFDGQRECGTNNRRYREMFDITDRSALRDLNRLVDLGLIRRFREGRSAGYVATRTQIT